MKKKNWTAKEVEYIQVLAQDVISLNTIVSSPDGELETEFGEMILDPSPGPEELAITKSRKRCYVKITCRTSAKRARSHDGTIRFSWWRTYDITRSC